MAMRIEDQLASTCHNFVYILRVRDKYFLINERNKGTKVGQAMREDHSIQYSADWTFIKRYSGARIGEVKRVTKETNVSMRINLDGSGIADTLGSFFLTTCRWTRMHSLGNLSKLQT
ncbi:uncharacterized protein LOC131333635 [Rhododendron vialii]|uniref:uncharacterized protein LOC131333635 n=1 Tax=Rhododendron vialii TaxID=182163 RepID=UPI00265F381A|nr:uncharacterized protein LOC131333635 [Rhododendron vialii]